MSAPLLIAGLDLGRAADYSVLAVVERSKLEKPVAKRRWRYALRHLEAWELGTRYTATREGERSVIGDLKARFDAPVLARSPLAVDFTGVGMAVVEQIQAAKVKARLHPVVITGGHAVSRPEETKDGSWHVPKVELVASLIVLLENGLLAWERPGSARSLKLAARWEKELGAFREFVTRKKNQTFEAQSGQHDDMVLAVSLACWLGEHCGAGGWEGAASGAGDDSPAAAPEGVHLAGDYAEPPPYQEGQADG